MGNHGSLLFSIYENNSLIDMLVREYINPNSSINEYLPHGNDEPTILLKNNDMLALYNENFVAWDIDYDAEQHSKLFGVPVIGVRSVGGNRLQLLFAKMVTWLRVPFVITDIGSRK